MSHSSISTSNRQTLIRVCQRGGLLLLPFLLCAAFFETIFWRGRECWPSAWVLQAFDVDSHTLYGPRFFPPEIQEIRNGRLRSGNVKVFALGSSRVTQFRAQMFAPMEDGFLNGGLAVTSLPELLSAVALFTEDKVPAPKAIIVGIDPWWIKKGSSRSADPEKQRAGILSPVSHLEAMRRVLAQASIPWEVLQPGFTHKDKYYGDEAIGIGALSGNSYRSDCSVQNCSQMADYVKKGRYRDRETPPVIERIRTRTLRFGETPGIDWKGAGKIVTALESLKAKGIEVYTFLPPFSTECDEALQEAKGLSVWYGEYRTEFLQRLAAAGIVCVNVSSPKTYGLTDDYMIDGFHSGDVLLTYVVEDMVRQAPAGSTMAAVDLDRLRALRQRPGLIPLCFDPPPALAAKAAPSPSPEK
jgi:hypothetical protein